ncbi:MAG TPA: ATP-binding protein [Armatimonadota bacterium]|nr:ATP-binding protein [Armatimonadota bacterium]
MIGEVHGSIQLSRETLLSELVEGLTSVLESAVGGDIASSCVGDAGIAVGVRLDRDFKKAMGIDRNLNFDEYFLMVDEALQSLYPTGAEVEAGDGQLQIRIQGTARRISMFTGPEFSAIAGSLFGATAAINFGFGKVCVTTESSEDGAIVHHIVVFTTDSKVARATPGEEFYPEIVAAFGDTETHLQVLTENRILREQLQESAAEYRERHRQISALAAIASTVSQSLDPEEVLSNGLQMLMDSIGVEVGAVFRVDDDTRRLELSYAVGINPDEARQILFDHVLPEQQTPGRDRWDALLSARRHSPPDWRCGEFQCYACAPMKSREHPIGVLITLARLRKNFSPLELELLELVANELGVGLENIRFHDYLARQVKRLTDLREISASLNGCTTLDQVLDLAADSLIRKLGFDRVGIFLKNEEENSLDRMRGTDEGGQIIRTDPLRIEIRPESGTMARAVLEKRPLHVLDDHNDVDVDLTADEASGLRNLHISAFARVPLIAENQVVGAISVDNAIRRRPITDEELNMLMIFGNHVAIAIGVARYTEALQRSAEELRRIDSIRSQFVGMISHELRTPLHRIRNASALIIDPETDPEDQRRFARGIIRSTDYLTAMVNNILTESRIEQAALRVEPARVDLATLTHNLLTELRAATLPQEQQVFVEIPADLFVLADAAYLKLILVNLLSNASKASARDGRIEVRAEGAGRFARICIRDYGSGIPPEQQEKVFERYFTFTRDSANQANKGVGLGLYITRILVDAHGGKIWLTSQPGEGSEFCFTIPTADPE